ncbi:MAG: Rdx family protein [Planctomycetes bacterium]|nr:Rdx family protein [Planctomycetota bacterium]
MTEQILKEHKQKITSLTLVPSDGGRFEVTVSGKLAFSKLAEKRFPDYAEIQKALKGRSKAKPVSSDQ